MLASFFPLAFSSILEYLSAGLPSLNETRRVYLALGIPFVCDTSPFAERITLIEWVVKGTRLYLVLATSRRALFMRGTLHP